MRPYQTLNPPSLDRWITVQFFSTGARWPACLTQMCLVRGLSRKFPYTMSHATICLVLACACTPGCRKPRPRCQLLAMRPRCRQAWWCGIPPPHVAYATSPSAFMRHELARHGVRQPDALVHRVEIKLPRRRRPASAAARRLPGPWRMILPRHSERTRASWIARKEFRPST